MDPFDATEATRKANLDARENTGFDWEDRRDFDFANRGFIARLEDPVIRNESGLVVWDMARYAFLDEENPPDTVHPSLWRQARLNMAHGLFKVTDRVYQVRGHDLSVISFIEGDKGWIVIDPLISAECAKASIDLLQENVGPRPVTAVIYTHSHVDHFGGVKGVVSDEQVKSGDVKILAPEGFLEAAVNENLMAGSAMGRRAGYMYGSVLPRNDRGQVDAGLGKTTSSGTITLIEPTEYIAETGKKLKVDGVQMVFQVTPNTEAPAEMNFFFPGMNALCMAENCSHNLHNLLTLRGAQVRDARAWAHYLGEAIELFGDSSELVFTSHHWPVWGHSELVEYLSRQRDMYRYLHDQTVRLMNKGYTGIEIADMIELPPSLAREWYNRGYYGSVSHNVKAIYQKYMGWFDGNPANLDALPPVEAGAKYVEFMGGADELLAKAKESFEAGEYRWVAQVVNHLVFADPDNEKAKGLQADALEQLGYQAENATWRNFYLTGALELREGVKTPEASFMGSNTDIVASLSPEMIFDFMAVNVDAEKAEGKSVEMNVDFTDSGRNFVLTLENSVLNHVETAASPGAKVTLRLSFAAFCGALISGAEGMKAQLASGAISVEGDGAALVELFSVIEKPGYWFDIVTP